MVNAWRNVSADQPCGICGKSDWCSVRADGTFAICRRVDGPHARPKVDRGGSTYWVYTLAEPERGTRGVAPARATVRAAPPVLDAVYGALLAELALSPADRSSLRGRGLSDEVIRRNAYRSLPAIGRARLAQTLESRFGAATCRQCPGLVRRNGVHGPYLTLAGAAGLVIPVRDDGGRIVALKVRRASGAHGPKYTYVSSRAAGGVGPGSPTHVPRHHGCPTAIVRLTEGELKADVATALGGMLTISVAGVAAWASALPTLRALGARACRLAFDADARNNLHVAAAVRNAALGLLVEGFALELEVWSPEFKGIDDCLAGGAPTQILKGGEAYAEAERLLAECPRGA